MNNYKHGNWYCKPVNEAEAREIIERALESGAKNPRGWKGTDGANQAYGVFHGFVSFDFEFAWVDSTEYTIEQVRELFPLPGEREDSLPTDKSLYRHTNGGVYRITGYANQETQKPDQYPVTIIYQNVVNGTTWCRPASEWARSFTPVDSEPSQDWDGEGLPPVRSVCSIQLAFNDMGKCEITYMGNGVYCYRQLSTNKEYTGSVPDTVFRTIRSERERWVDDVNTRYTSGAHHSTVKDIAGFIFDAIESGELKAPE